MSDQFTKKADEVVEEFMNDLPLLSAEHPSHPSNSPIYNRKELGKLHRKVWVDWARQQKECPEGWLVSFENQTPAHQEAQMRQAETLFSLGYRAAYASPEQDIPASSKRATIQAFTVPEARLLIAATMAFFAFHLKKKSVAFLPGIVKGLLKKLAVIGELNVDDVDYMVPSDAKKVARVKPKWKKQCGDKPFKKRHGLKHMVKQR